MIKFKRSKTANVMVTEMKPIFSDKKYLNPLIELVPRNKDVGGVIKMQVQEEEEIEEEQNNEDFFRDCNRDTDDVYVKCFETDWSKSSISRIVKNQDDQVAVKIYLKSIYKDLVTVYR